MKRVDVNEVSGTGVSAVPAIVLEDGTSLVGKDAFEYVEGIKGDGISSRTKVLIVVVLIALGLYLAHRKYGILTGPIATINSFKQTLMSSV